MTLSHVALLALALLLPLRAASLDPFALRRVAAAAAAAHETRWDETRSHETRSHETSPFGTSLQIVAPGPRGEPDGLSYRLTLGWSPRAGAMGYRVFTWTDAARAWYRAAQTSGQRAEMRAFRSGCTAFVVVAVTDTSASPKSLAGLDTTNVVRFPLSTRQELCPARL